MQEQEAATILAALRYYQENGQGDPANRTQWTHDIATNMDLVVSLDDDGIDELCEKLNQEPEVSVFTVSRLTDAYVVHTQEVITDTAEEALRISRLFPERWVSSHVSEFDHHDYTVHDADGDEVIGI